MNAETETRDKYYQWIKGENAGNIETWKDGNMDDSDGEMTFMIFKSGRQINLDLLPEFMVEIDDPKNPLVDPDFLNIPAAKAPQRKAAVAPPKPTPKPQVETNPVFALLEKSIKTETPQNLKVVLNLPPKDLIKVVASSFDDGQDNVLDYLISQIPVEDLQKQIKEQLRQTLFAEKTSRKRND